MLDLRHARNRHWLELAVTVPDSVGPVEPPNLDLGRCAAWRENELNGVVVACHSKVSIQTRFRDFHRVDVVGREADGVGVRLCDALNQLLGSARS